MRLLIPLIATVVLFLNTTPIYADLGDELFKLIPDDGEAHDYFGSSVAISGTTAIIGATRDDDNGIDAGSAYLFDITTGKQVFKLLANDGAADDYFGIAVAISDTIAVVGSYHDGDNGYHSGSVYLFDVTTGKQIAKYLPDDGEPLDWFGRSLAIRGETLIVGAPGYDNKSGSVYVFNVTNGKQIHKLLPEDYTESSSFFGWGLAIARTTIVIGRPGDNFNGADSGSAYLFDVITGKQITKYMPADAEAGDLFGTVVAINENTVLVGAWSKSDFGISSGAAYLFDTITKQQIAKLLPSDPNENDYFGFSVALGGLPGEEFALVGSPKGHHLGVLGSAYIFDAKTGKQIVEILPKSGIGGDIFGYRAAISETTAILGAHRDDIFGTDSGSAYLFDASLSSICPWDLDNSGTVGASDLLALLASWGPCKGCPADFDGNGNVGVSDFLALLATWGPCP